MKNIVDQFRIDGKIAMITGASQGIGLELARAYGQAGAIVILNGRSEEKLNNAVKMLGYEGIKAYAVPFNVCNEAEVSAGIDNIQKSVGIIDILVNNAGIIKRQSLLEMPTSDFRDVIEMNLISVFVVSKYVALGMIKRRVEKLSTLFDDE